MKTSGLADSPFFVRPTLEQERVQANPPQPDQPVYERPNDRSTERTAERPNVRPNERIQKPITRVFHRYSFDIFDDQVAAIDDLTFKRRKEQGRHVTKGEVIRALLDQALKTTE